MKLDLVDPVPEAVVRAQHRRVLVGEPAPFPGLLAPGEPAGRVHLRLGPARALPVQRLQQRRVGGRVDVAQR